MTSHYGVGTAGRFGQLIREIRRKTERANRLTRRGTLVGEKRLSHELFERGQSINRANHDNPIRPEELMEWHDKAAALEAELVALRTPNTEG